MSYSAKEIPVGITSWWI